MSGIFKGFSDVDTVSQCDNLGLSYSARLVGEAIIDNNDFMEARDKHVIRMIW